MGFAVFYLAQHKLYDVKARKTAQPGESLHFCVTWHTMTVKRKGLDAMREEDDILTVYDVARLLHISVTFARDLAARGELPGRKVGRAWRFSRRQLLRWLEETQPAPTDETG